MALHYITIVAPQGAWGGENSDWPADILMPGQLSATESVAHEGAEIVCCPGQFREPDAVTGAGTSVVAGFTANYSTGQKVIVQSANGRFYQTSSGMTTWAAMGTSAFWAPATFAQLGDIVAICTVSGTMLGTSGTDGVFDLDAGLTGVSAAPAAQFVPSHKNRLSAAARPTPACPPGAGRPARTGSSSRPSGPPQACPWSPTGTARTTQATACLAKARASS